MTLSVEKRDFRGCVWSECREVSGSGQYLYEQLRSGSEAKATVLTALRQTEDEGMVKEWKQLLALPLPKKGNIKQCQNYRTTSVISHPSMMVL